MIRVLCGLSLLFVNNMMVIDVLLLLCFRELVKEYEEVSKGEKKVEIKGFGEFK